MQRITNMESFNQIIQSEQPVIIKFEAGWCPDCKAMDMWIDPIIEKYNQYDWYSVDRDELDQAVEEYEVMGIPSILIFKDGQKLHHLHSANAKSPEQVENYLAESLG
ncbi:thiol reductase thioredoxin [Staphylococcus coagulans]|uniref:Thioredoxin family protein n=1 Tax=Staphylococcus coagulans TaxID=74706 RepID=A0ABU1EYZ0_9STAP|nr:thioredoxin family protein [Staphylococcus coagulans]MBA8759522.1 thiol reductase thioredoxin [Staphylococcus coagulans]MBA8767698.1 thiol reductase thioredoxin [Staphylococcus coagulans]MBA8779691.1 thioredoxin family protein [Staphylococcus coagulans]MBT2813381.1 thioredoxin family protein [Staphylococcus coagulans]MBT2815644.1 thioredoxin family protein [Staphylococcus coagulans]